MEKDHHLASLGLKDSLLITAADDSLKNASKKRTDTSNSFRTKDSSIRKRKKTTKRTNLTTQSEEQEMRVALQQQKRRFKEMNYKAHLERLERAEEERQDKQVFQDCNSNLDMVRQVRLYKQVKNDLFSWG